MTTAAEDVLASWPASPWLAASLLVTAALYLRGYYHYRSRDPAHWPPLRPAAFLGGLAAVFLAFGSPIEPFASLLLSVHMVQHVLLMMAAPPLFWLGHPLLPIIRGLPEPIRKYWLVPLFQSPPLRRIASNLVHPLPALVVFAVATLVWHVPYLYELAVESPPWHFLQHACFLAGGLIFWFPVVRPYPYRPPWSMWLLFPYLLLADLANTVLSALLAFAPTAVYPHYAILPPIFGGSAQEDQAAAGALMWVVGSTVYLFPLAGFGMSLLRGQSERPSHKEAKQGRLYHEKPHHPGERIPLLVLGPARAQPQFDLLRVPVLGHFLRWRYARRALQAPMLALAAIVVLDGFIGPDVGAMNLASVLVWVLWRGLLAITLVVGGNFLCTACPFQLPRSLARKILPRRWPWPRMLRGKWLALSLVVGFFTAAEAFSLWDRPQWTAWIVIGYFAAAFLVDGLFHGAAFCKYVCPIGQFNFVQSLASPVEVAVRDPKVCSACKTKDCLRGRDGIPGCELDLFPPRKRGNMDCTFCLDCVHACPHGNIGLVAGAPGRGLEDDAPRSGVGRLGQRMDVAALVVVLVFAAFASAAAMVGPVLTWDSQLRTELGLDSPQAITVILYLLAILVLPAISVGLTAAASRGLGQLPLGSRGVAMRFSVSLVPLGLGMWFAHFGYHLATSWVSLWPAVQRFASDLGWPALGSPQWTPGCCIAPGEWLMKAQLVALDLGLLLSLYVAYHTSREVAGITHRVALAFMPWAALIVAMFAAGVWIVMQPMVMM